MEIELPPPVSVDEVRDGLKFGSRRRVLKIGELGMFGSRIAVKNHILANYFS